MADRLQAPEVMDSPDRAGGVRDDRRAAAVSWPLPGPWPSRRDGQRRPTGRRSPASSTRPPGTGRAGTAHRGTRVLRVGDPGQPPGAGEAGPHPVVADRPHIETAQGAEQEHVRRPGADAADPGEVVDDGVVGQPADALQGDLPGDDLVGQVADGGGLGPAQAGGGQQLRVTPPGPRRASPSPPAPARSGRGWWRRPCRPAAGRR